MQRVRLDENDEPFLRQIEVAREDVMRRKSDQSVFTGDEPHALDIDTTNLPAEDVARRIVAAAATRPETARP